MSTQGFLAKNAFVVALTLGMSAVLGFLREAAMAYKFGATAETDAYLIAMIIPTLFINLIKNSLTNTFITVYGGYLANGQAEEGWRMTNTILSLLFVIMVGMVFLFSVGAPGIVHLFAPSYEGEQLRLAVGLTRVLVPSMLFGTLMGVLVGINNAHHSFMAPSLVNVVSNAVTILCIFLLGSSWGIYGLAVGSLLGIAAQFLIQLPSARRHGFRFSFEADFSHAGFRETLHLVAPFLLSGAAVQVNLIVDRALATGLPKGIVSSLYFANKLLFLPQNIFMGAVGMVIFPVLIRAATRRDWGELLEGFQRSVRLLSLVLLPAAFGIYILRVPLVRLLFEHGAFTAADTKVTAGTIGYFLGAVYFGALVGMVTNIFFALKKMFVAVGTGLVAMMVNIGLSLWLIQPLAQRGLALANSLAAFTNLCLLTAGLVIVLRQQGISLNPFAGLGLFLGRVGLAVVGMSVVVSGYERFLFVVVHGKGELAFFVFTAIGLGIIVFGVLTYLLNVDEVRKGLAFLLLKIRRGTGKLE